jgi:hypothetical protein
MFLPFPAAPLKSIIGCLAFFETYEILFTEPADNARMHPGTPIQKLDDNGN